MHYHGVSDFIFTYRCMAIWHWIRDVINLVLIRFRQRWATIIVSVNTFLLLLTWCSLRQCMLYILIWDIGCYRSILLLKARRGFAFVTESWVRKFDGQLSACAQIIYDVMESVGGKEITSFTVKSWGCKTQYFCVFWGGGGQSCRP